MELNRKADIIPIVFGALLVVILIISLTSLILVIVFGSAAKQSSNPADTNQVDNSKERFRLHYFDIRGRGEQTRLLFAYAGQPFEDVRYNSSYWKSDIKKTALYGQLPILELGNGQRLYQSYVINRYLAKRLNTAFGRDSWEQAKVDEFADFHKDNDVQLYALGYTDKMKSDDARMPALVKRTDELFSMYVRQLNSSTSGFLMPSGVTWVDFTITNFLETYSNTNPQVFANGKWAELLAYKDRVLGVPQLAEYVKNRK